MGKGRKIKEFRVSGLLLRLSWKLLSLTTCTSIYSVRFCKNLLGFLSKGFTHMKTCFHHDQAITPAHGNNHIWTGNSFFSTKDTHCPCSCVF